MSANTDYIKAEQAKQLAYYTDSVAEYEVSKTNFENTILNPGTGFDIEYWLGLLPPVGLIKTDLTDIPDLVSYLANDLAPDVVKPTLITPDDISLLATAGYDSQYLEDIEQEIRTITSDIITAVLPAGSYDDYYLVDSSRRARDASDAIDKAREKEEGRGFAVATMTLVREITEVVTKWQNDTYLSQNEVSKKILDRAIQTYFSSVNHGVDIEDIRSRVIMDYAKFYSDQNMVLASYYGQFVDEKIAAATLAYQNLKNALDQEISNVETAKNDNKEEVDLAISFFQSALDRLKQEATVDEELVKRRFMAMEKICEIYAGWMASSVGSLQSTTSPKYDITE